MSSLVLCDRENQKVWAPVADNGCAYYRLCDSRRCQPGAHARAWRGEYLHRTNRRCGSYRDCTSNAKQVTNSDGNFNKKYRLSNTHGYTDVNLSSAGIYIFTFRADSGRNQ